MTTIARPSRLDDVYDLAPRLREEDKREIMTGSGHSPEESLLNGLRTSEECLTIEKEGSIIGMFGCARAEGGVGIIWLLASDDLPKIRWEFLKKTRPWVQYFQTKYKVLMNVVDSRNTVHVKWIKWAGFTFTNDHTVNGVVFHEFYKEGNLCAMHSPLSLSLVS